MAASTGCSPTTGPVKLQASSLPARTLSSSAAKASRFGLLPDTSVWCRCGLSLRRLLSNSVCRYEDELEAYFERPTTATARPRRAAPGGVPGRGCRATRPMLRRGTGRRRSPQQRKGRQGRWGGGDQAEGELGGPDGTVGEDEDAAPGARILCWCRREGRCLRMSRGERMVSAVVQPGRVSGPGDAGGDPAATVGSAKDRNGGMDKGSVAEKAKSGSRVGGVEAVKERRKKGRKEKKPSGLSVPQEDTAKNEKVLARDTMAASTGPVATSLSGKQAKGQSKQKGERLTPPQARPRARPGLLGGGWWRSVRMSREFEVVPAAEDLSDSDPGMAQGSESDSDSEEEGQARVEVNDED